MKISQAIICRAIRIIGMSKTCISAQLCNCWFIVFSLYEICIKYISFYSNINRLLNFTLTAARAIYIRLSNKCTNIDSCPYQQMLTQLLKGHISIFSSTEQLFSQFSSDAITTNTCVMSNSLTIVTK